MPAAPCWSPSRGVPLRFASVACMEGLLRLVDAARGLVVETQSAPSPVFNIAVHGPRVAIASHLLHVTGGTLPAAPWSAHGGSTFCVAFSPDGRRIASGGADHLIRLWTLGGTELVVLEGGLRPIIQSPVRGARSRSGPLGARTHGLDGWGRVDPRNSRPPHPALAGGGRHARRDRGAALLRSRFRGRVPGAPGPASRRLPVAQVHTARRDQAFARVVDLPHWALACTLCFLFLGPLGVTSILESRLALCR